MDFQRLNLLNTRMNLISGNLLPLTPDSSFPIAWKVYSFVLWLMQVTQMIVLILGMVSVPLEKALIDGTVTFVVHVEAFFMLARIQMHKQLAGRLIRKMNDVLHVEDKIMRRVVIATLKPMEAPLKFYWIAGGLSVVLWCCMPFILLFEKTSFLYEDYRVPMVFTKQQPFTADVYLMGCVFTLFGCLYIFLKKAGVDVYMIHLALLLTAQYRYLAVSLAMIFRDADLQEGSNDGSHQEYRTRVNRWVEEKIKALCCHHNAVIDLSSLLRKLLAVNLSMVCVNSIFRFCFIGVMLSTVGSMSLEGFIIVTFAFGSLIQFYMLCYSVQQLIDASKETTNEAFHEKWYEFGPSVKRIFMLMILSNNLECKLSSCDKFSLSLPSFMMILNQSYSIALLFLRMK